MLAGAHRHSREPHRRLAACLHGGSRAHLPAAEPRPGRRGARGRPAPACESLGHHDRRGGPRPCAGCARGLRRGRSHGPLRGGLSRARPHRHRVADHPHRGHRPASRAVVWLRPHAEGAARGAGDVLPHHGVARERLSQRGPGHHRPHAAARSSGSPSCPRP